MSTVADLAGNNPVALDPTVTRHDKVSSVEFRGAGHSIAIDATIRITPVFGNRTRFIRIAPDGDIYYHVAVVPDVSDITLLAFLGANAVESIPIRPGERMELVQANAATGLCTIREDTV